MTAATAYDYLVEIAGWSGPSYLAARPLSYAGNGYDPLLIEVRALKQSVDPGHRGQCQIKVSNEPYGAAGARFSSYFAASKIEGRAVTVREVFRDGSSSRVLFAGVVRVRRYSQDVVDIEVVESDLARSKRLDMMVSEADWTRAKPADVGKSIPVVFNDVPDLVGPVVAWNAHSRTAAELDASATDPIELDSVEGFPSSGTVRIDREKITYTGITNNTLTGVTRGASSTTAAAHIQGSLCIVVNTFDVAIDATTEGATVTLAEAVDSERRRWPLPDPDSIEEVNGATLARWDETPTYQEPVGELEAVAIELDQDGGSTAGDYVNALGRASGYDDSSYAEVHRYGTPEEAWIGYSSISHATRGRIKKILAQVVHSGNNSALVVASGTSLLGTSPVKVETQIGSPRQFIGNLSPVDQIDADFLEIAERKGSRAVQVGSNTTSITGVPIRPNAVSEDAHISGYGGQPTRSVRDQMIDGDYGNPILIGAGGGAAGGKYHFTISSLPPGINTAAVLNKVVFKWRHGGSTETSTFTAKISLLRSSSTVAGPGTFNPNSSTETDEAATYSPPSDTIADLTKYEGVIEIVTGGNWRGVEGWFEIDYTDATADQEAGSVVNQWDVTSILDTWEKVSNGLIDVRADDTSTGFRLYHAGFIVLYEPLMERVPDRLALAVSGGIVGNPADVIDALWRTIAGNPAGSISSSDVTAAGTALETAGFDEDSVSGAIRDEDLMTTVQRLARECRIRAYVLNDVLRLAYQDDIADLADPARRIDATDLAAAPTIDGSDVEDQVRNLVRVQYALSEVDDFTASLEDEDASSISSYGERLEELGLLFIRTSAAAQKVIDLILDRRAEPFDAFMFEVDLTLRSLELLELLELRWGWFESARFEVEELSETGEHTIEVRGRVLT